MVGANELERPDEPNMGEALPCFLHGPVKPLVDRTRKPEDDFSLYVNGEWKECLHLGDMDPFALRRVIVWKCFLSGGNIDTRGRNAGYSRGTDLFPIGMPLRRGIYVVSVGTKQ